MAKWRRAAKCDINQPDIVRQLRKIPGVSVALGHDDLLIGYKNRTYWIELKSEYAVGKNGINDSSLKESQKLLLKTWKGHYCVVWSLDQILEEIGIRGQNDKTH